MKSLLRRARRGFTLVEILTAIVIVALVAGAGFYYFTPTIAVATEQSADILASNITDIYLKKTGSGMQHDNTASATLTKNLLDVITTQPATLAGANITGTGWVNEQIIRTNSGHSIAAAAGTLTLPYTYEVSGNNVLYNGQFVITFTPTSSKTGTWTVTVTGANALPSQ